MVYPHLHFLYNLSLTWFMKNYKTALPPLLNSECDALLLSCSVSSCLCANCVTGVNESKSQWIELNIVLDTL